MRGGERESSFGLSKGGGMVDEGCVLMLATTSEVSVCPLREETGTYGRAVEPRLRHTVSNLGGHCAERRVSLKEDDDQKGNS